MSVESEFGASMSGLRGSLPVALGGLMLLASLVRVVSFYTGPVEALIGVVPDDAFYYLQMARHRADEGLWSFDGVHPSTGFHALFGHMLVALFLVAPGLEWGDLYLLTGAAASLAMGASVFLVSRLMAGAYGEKAALAAVLPFFSPVLLQQATAMMEAWLVVPLASLTVGLAAREGRLSAREACLLAVTGLFGSLARTDFGLLPAALACAALVAPGAGGRVTRSGYILAGAVVGVLLVAWQNHLIAGHFTQASAQTKLFWSSVSGHSAWAPLSLLLTLLAPALALLGKGWKVLAVVTSAALVTAACWVAVRRSHGGCSTPVFLLFGGSLALVGYVAVYSFNSQALQPWYVANMVVPVVLCLAGVVRHLLGTHALTVAVPMAAVVAWSCSARLLEVPWPHQVGMMHAGLALRDTALEGRVGAWNAGIVSYFSRRPIVNLDGLANDRVLGPIRANRLLEFVREGDVSYIADYEVMLEDRLLRVRGGYDDARVDRCLAPLRQLDGGARPWRASRLMLYRVDRDCLGPSR